MRISLNGAWKLTYFPEGADAPRTPAEIDRKGYAELPAEVPGEAYLDLMRAGIEPDPLVGENLYRYRKYEFYRWMYRRSFTVPAGTGRLLLRFEGINTMAEIFVNGVSVGQAENMLIPHEFDVTDAVRRGEENELAVVIRSAVNEARKLDFPVCVTSGDHTDEYAYLRMPPSCFGWDIMPRLISAGLWRSVWLEELPPTRITQAYYATSSVVTDGAGTRAVLEVRCRFTTDAETLDGFTVRVSGRCGESSFHTEIPARFVSCFGALEIREPCLWWPAGYGEPALYEVTMDLLRYGELLDSRTERIGIRTLDLELKTEPGDAGEFLVRCNGVPILCKGSNWVPLDALHSRDAGRYAWAIGLWKDVGCNILRCWGGNVYEDDAFYRLCDEAGIMVWQDFCFACATYPQGPEFMDRVYREAVRVIRDRRNHPCILLWAGDNECDENYYWRNFKMRFNRHNAVTREALPLAVRENDPYREYLPSSPYLPEGSPWNFTPEQHTWGARAWFKDEQYKNTAAHFVSECGYHGCPDLESLRRMLPPEELWPIRADGAWNTHSSDNRDNVRRGYNRNFLMRDQVEILCGRVPENAEDFVLFSQLSQAEAVKFFVERTRIKKWRRTGIIWWNMLDGWPQISDAVVDWYGRKKLAYGWLKRVHVPVCLMADEESGWERKFVLGNDSRTSGSVEWEITDGDTGEILLRGSAFSPANENVTVGSLRVCPGEKRLYLMRWTWQGKTFRNHYLMGMPPYDEEDLRRWTEIIRGLEEAT